MIIKPRKESGAPEVRPRGFSNYVFDTRGRSFSPVLIQGCREAFDAVGLARSKVSVAPVSTFDIGFREKLGLDVARAIFGRIDEFITVGLDPSIIFSLGGYHEKEGEQDFRDDDQSESASVTTSSDGHLGYLKFLAHSGVQWSPYFDKVDRAGLTALQEILNYEFGLASPKDPATWRKVVFPDLDKDGREGWANEFQVAAIERHSGHPFSSQSDFVQFVKKQPGVSQVNWGPNSVHPVVDGREICIKGCLATAWFYDNPQKYARLTRSEYQGILDSSLEARKRRHKELHKVKALNQPLRWVNLLPAAHLKDAELLKDYPRSQTHTKAAPALEPATTVQSGVDSCTKLEAVVELLASSGLGANYDVEHAALKKGIRLDAFVTFRGRFLVINPTLKKSGAVIFDELIDQLTLLIAMWNEAVAELEREREKEGEEPSRRRFQGR